MNPDQIAQQEIFRPILIYGIPIFGLIILLIANYIQCWNLTHQKNDPPLMKDPILGWYITAVLMGVIINIGMAYSLRDQITASYRIQAQAMEVLKETNDLNSKQFSITQNLNSNILWIQDFMTTAYPDQDSKYRMFNRIKKLESKVFPD